MENKEIYTPKYLKEANEVTNAAWVINYGDDSLNEQPNLGRAVAPEHYNPNRDVESVLESKFPTDAEFRNALVSTVKITAFCFAVYAAAQKMGVYPEVALVAASFLSTGYPLLKRMIMNRMRRI